MTLPSTVGKNMPLVVASGLALVGVLLFRAYLNWGALVLTVRVQDLTGLLAPLAFAAACIERAVEIFVSPWRDAGASKLAKDVAAVQAAIQAKSADPAACAQNAAELKAASDRLDEYRGATQRYAFAASLTLSVLVSMAGVRALGSFVAAEKLKDRAFTDGSQYPFFLCVDVILSAALLAGGADGIHSLVNAATSFFDSTAAKASKTP
jgi:hypothetical protein